MIRKKQIEVGKFTFDALISGEPDRPLVLMLHGYPETNNIYKKLLSDLSEKGYYCVAPNLRGYSRGARPRGKRHYKLQYLVQDIADMAKSLGYNRFHLVGHDWGAVIGWAVCDTYSSQVMSWSALSVPHPEAFSAALANDPAQETMSHYIRKFQTRWLPEWILSKKDYKRLKSVWIDHSPEEKEEHLEVFRSRGALTAAINYYRANYKMLQRKENLVGPINTPTLLIWGNDDEAISRRAVEMGHDYAKGEYKFVEIDGRHWLMQANYEECRDHIIPHIESHST